MTADHGPLSPNGVRCPDCGWPVPPEHDAAIAARALREAADDYLAQHPQMTRRADGSMGQWYETPGAVYKWLAARAEAVTDDDLAKHDAEIAERTLLEAAGEADRKHETEHDPWYWTDVSKWLRARAEQVNP